MRLNSLLQLHLDHGSEGISDHPDCRAHIALQRSALCSFTHSDGISVPDATWSGALVWAAGPNTSRGDRSGRVVSGCAGCCPRQRSVRPLVTLGQSSQLLSLCRNQYNPSRLVTSNRSQHSTHSPACLASPIPTPTLPPSSSTPDSPTHFPFAHTASCKHRRRPCPFTPESVSPDLTGQGGDTTTPLPRTPPLCSGRGSISRSLLWPCVRRGRRPQAHRWTFAPSPASELGSSPRTLRRQVHMPSCTLSSQVCDLELTSARGELLAWLNELLAPNVIQKVEECGKGIIYCQVSLRTASRAVRSVRRGRARRSRRHLDASAHCCTARVLLLDRNSTSALPVQPQSICRNRGIERRRLQLRSGLAKLTSDP